MGLQQLLGPSGDFRWQWNLGRFALVHGQVKTEQIVDRCERMLKVERNVGVAGKKRNRHRRQGILNETGPNIRNWFVLITRDEDEVRNRRKRFLHRHALPLTQE